jgi:CheY-like chemotaxis protein
MATQCRAINGKAGLECLARKQTDVVFVDLMMPVMGGEKMIAEMRSRVELAAIPVVLMTALPEAIKGDSGANAVLVKPFSFKELIATIRDLLHE